MKEGTLFDRKSLKTVIGKTKNFGELAKDCVAFANSRGGSLHIGIEDNQLLPPANQRVPKDLPDIIVKRLNELTINVGLKADLIVAANGGEYIILTILMSRTSVASTTTGQYYLRDNDKSRPVLPDELLRLVADKSAYCWETKVTQNVPFDACDPSKLNAFYQAIHNSDRVSAFVKEKSSRELLLYYQMLDEETGYLTNLGILWVGKTSHRARLLYSPVVQFIKYDAAENKTQKVMWDDYSKNPMELIEDIWQTVPDWKESYEVSNGLWRKHIPAYDEKVVRELLCNAIVHRPYTTRGDIFINVYPDRMTIVNPGLLPLGITSDNILQKTIKRNEHLAKVFYDLKMMEAEGSGYDMMYETLLAAGKSLPVVIEGDDSVSVTVERKVLNQEVSRITDYVFNNYERISQKNRIALGAILNAGTITAVKLASTLQLDDNERLRDYTSRLIDAHIILGNGKGKGTSYSINPLVISSSQSNIQTTLRTIEPYRLKALVMEDLKFHPNSSVQEISSRLPDVDFTRLQDLVRKMARANEIKSLGGRKYRKYSL